MRINHEPDAATQHLDLPVLVTQLRMERSATYTPASGPAAPASWTRASPQAGSQASPQNSNGGHCCASAATSSKQERDRPANRPAKSPFASATGQQTDIERGTVALQHAHALLVPAGMTAEDKIPNRVWGAMMPKGYD